MTDFGSVLSLTLLGLLSALVYYILFYGNGYWKKRGIKEAKGYPIVGCFPSAVTKKQHFGDDIDDIYRQFKDDEDFVGFYTSKKPQLLLMNPELCHRVHVTDFKHFHDNEISDFVDAKRDFILSNNPFTIKGETWKNRRHQLIPGLTAVRIKNAYPVTLEVCDRFKKYIDEQIKVGSKDGIDTIDLALRFTCEVSTDCVLGVKANTMGGESTGVLEMTKAIFEDGGFIIVYTLIVRLFPGLEKFYKIRFFPKKCEVFFYDLMKQAVAIRQKSNNDRADFLNYLLALKKEKNYDNQTMTAHTMTFLIDGFYTTALAIAHCFLGLARYPDRERKLREEILANIGPNGKIDFETLSEMPYLDACLHEAIRLFTSLVVTNKICTVPYEFEKKDGTKLKVNVGDIITIPTNSLHLDEKYYEKPKEFMPERFLGPETVKSYREKGLYYGFGEGPRVCIGMRFALTQGKAAVAEVIRNYELKVNPKTRSDNKLAPTELVAQLDGGVWLDFVPLNK